MGDRKNLEVALFFESCHRETNEKGHSPVSNAFGYTLLTVSVKSNRFDGLHSITAAVCSKRPHRRTEELRSIQEEAIQMNFKFWEGFVAREIIKGLFLHLMPSVFPESKYRIKRNFLSLS